jgi:alpha,alpha-trehalose phosphorylase
MARENLWCAVAAVRELSKERPEQYTALVHATGLNLAEVDDWKRAADNMYVPFDERLGIHPQDDSFLDREVWDFENTPPEKYPLLLYHHPLVIYRHQVIKQADIVLAMFLLGHEFSTEQKRRNFDYYDPLTTGDSSLSVCIQSILAAEIGRQELSVEYLRYAVLMDLADVGGNVKDGCHIASMGGTWMALVYGFAGLRDHGGKISFHPRRLLRAGVTLKFQLAIAGQRLEVVVEKESCTYRLREGRGLTIWHWDEEVRLSEAAHLTVPITRETGA